jgi:hypothetical protein
VAKTNRNCLAAVMAGLALVLLAGAAGPAQAYTFKFKNGMNQSRGKPVKVQYTLNKVMSHEDFFVGVLAPGESATKDHGGWESGLCVDRLKFWVEQNLPGCEKQSIARQFFYQEGLWCGDKTFVIQREGCSLQLEVK